LGKKTKSKILLHTLTSGIIYGHKGNLPFLDGVGLLEEESKGDQGKGAGGKPSKSKKISQVVSKSPKAGALDESEHASEKKPHGV